MQKLTYFINNLLEISFYIEYNLKYENVPELIGETIDARLYVTCNTYLLITSNKFCRNFLNYYIKVV